MNKLSAVFMTCHKGKPLTWDQYSLTLTLNILAVVFMTYITRSILCYAVDIDSFFQIFVV